MLTLMLLATLNWGMTVNLWANQGFTITSFGSVNGQNVGISTNITGSGDRTGPPIRSFSIARDSTKTGLSAFVIVNSKTDLTPCNTCGSLILTDPNTLTFAPPPDPPTITQAVVQ